MAARRKRRFGTIRKLPSGRWQARYRGSDGLMRSAPHTFTRQTGPGAVADGRGVRDPPRRVDRLVAVRAAKVYRLLRAILYTAVDDGMIKRNPCRIKGADKETEHARPVATVGQVHALADAVPRRFRALVLLGAFTSLRWGELVNLRRVNVDPGAGLVEVADTLSERDDGTLDAGRPGQMPDAARWRFPQ